MLTKLLSLTALCFGLVVHGDPELSQITQGLTQKLNPAGYSVRSGKARQFGIEDCDRVVPIFGNCFGNNPAAPYVVALVPQIPGEYLDPYYNTSFIYPEEDAGLSLSYRLNPNEAVILMGQTPPQGAYFGAQTYLFARQGTPKPPLWFSFFLGEETTSLFFFVSPNPERFLSFSSLSESINHVRMSRQLGAPSAFDRRFYTIHSADPQTANTVKQALIGAGAAEKAIFIEALPNSVKLGLGASSDDLTTLVRYALPKNESEGERWRDTLPLSVLRVSGPDSAIGSVKRFGPQPESVLTGNDESGLLVALRDLTFELKQGLGISLFTETSEFLPASSINLTGKKCIPATMNCLGETLDTDTYRISSAVVLDSNDVLVVAGVDHTETGNATYVSLSVNDQSILKGVASESQTGTAAGFVSGRLKGSASAFLAEEGRRISPALSVAKEKLYLRLFARNCSGLPFCTVISAAKVALDKPLVLTQRAYVKPGDSLGADPTKLLSPRLIVWKR